MNIPSNNPNRNPFAATRQGALPLAQQALPELPVDRSTMDRLTLTAVTERDGLVAAAVEAVTQPKREEPLAEPSASPAKTKTGTTQGKGHSAKQEGDTSGQTLELSAEEVEKRAMERFERLERARSTLPKPFQDQEAAMEKVLAEGKGPFTNTAGATHEVTIVKDGDKPRYEVKIGGNSFEVTIAQDLDVKGNLAKLLDFYTKIPDHLRGNLKAVTLETVLSPQDAYWKKIYGNDNFMAAASAGGGAITFWGLKERPQNLGEGTFNHESGHLIGEKLSSSRKEYATMIPPGWEEAAKADGNRVSDYAGMNPDEDFAESWEAFLAAHKDPEKLKAFQEKYPHRSPILEVIHQGRENPDKVKMSEVKKDVERMLKNEGSKDA